VLSCPSISAACSYFAPTQTSIVSCHLLPPSPAGGCGSASDCAICLIAMRIAALVLVLPFFALRCRVTLRRRVLSSRVRLIPIRVVISLTMTK
jgi:hypothetical protein